LQGQGDFSERQGQLMFSHGTADTAFPLKLPESAAETLYAGKADWPACVGEAA
jgi:hypothetical protein